jgi:hypothetical protein
MVPKLGHVAHRLYLNLSHMAFRLGIDLAMSNLAKEILFHFKKMGASMFKRTIMIKANVLFF